MNVKIDVAGLDRLGHVQFCRDDVARHELAPQIVQAYQGAKARPRNGPLR